MSAGTVGKQNGFACCSFEVTKETKLMNYMYALVRGEASVTFSPVLSPEAEEFSPLNGPTAGASSVAFCERGVVS